MRSLMVLSLPGNRLVDVPESVGSLVNLQALIVNDNAIERIPASIAMLSSLKSLYLHKNRLKHLPRDIITLRNLIEVSWGLFGQMNISLSHMFTYVPLSSYLLLSNENCINYYVLC